MKTPEYEKGYIAALLLKPELALKVAGNYGLSKEHFTNGDHQEIFKAATTLSEQQKPVDAFTIAAESKVSASTIQKLIDGCPTAAHAEYYARALRDAHIKQQALAEIGKTTGAEGLRMLFEKFLFETTSISEPRTACVNCNDWLNEPDEEDRPIIHGLFDAGDRVAIVGQSKARKSFYALQLAISIATGTELLGATPEAQRTLLINGEISSRSYKKRLRRMIAKMEIQPEQLENLIVINASERKEPMSFNFILSMAKKHNATVCVIDPAYLLLGDEIDQKQVKEAVQSMKLFAAEGVTLVSVFHATKGRIGDRQTIDRISGSGIFARDAAAIISLCEHASEADHVVLSTITRNFAPSDPITICFDEGAFQLSDIAPVEKNSSTKARRTIPLDQAIKCFSSDSISYSEAITRIKKQFSCGDNRAKEVIRDLRDSADFNLFSMRVGTRTLYSTYPANDQGKDSV